MPEYALVFRPTRSLTPEELPRRNAAAREWALARGSAGTLRNASPFEDGGVVVEQGRVAPLVRDGAIASVLIVDAPDLESAVALAKDHPGLAFGTQIEVRPVKPVGTPNARAR